VIDQAFIKLHGDLPRQGVGADWCTREALKRLPPLRKPPTVIDLGCGPGRQTIVLAQHFRTPIQAVDNCKLFLEQMTEAAAAAGVAELITPRLTDFSDLSDPMGSFDLVWSEGSARVLGMERSLALWAPLLRARGVMAVSECTWLAEPPPEPARAFWSHAYPEMTDIAGNIAHARKAGLTVFDHFTLPRSAWWDEYYAPLSRRLAALRNEAESDPALAAYLAATQEEIALFQRWGDSYGYVFYLMRPA